MAAWPPLTMKDIVDGHERSLSPPHRPSPAGKWSVVSRLCDFHDKIPRIRPGPDIFGVTLIHRRFAHNTSGALCPVRR